MLKRFLTVVAAAAALAVPVSAQTADEVIAKHLQARGGLEKIRAVQSLRFTGRMELGPGLEAPFVQEVKRPDKTRLEFTVQGMTGIQAYDGKSGWQVMPFAGKTDAEPMSPDDLKDAEEQADIDGPLVDYKTKGHTVELLGKEKVEGSDAYKLKLTLKNGNIHTLYIDADSYLDVKDISKRTIRGSETEIESMSGEFKEVNGLLFPFAIEQGEKGSPQKRHIVLEKVEVNPSLDDSRYKMPAPKPVETKPAETKP